MRRLLTALLSLLPAAGAFAAQQDDYEIHYEASATAAVASGSFTPYYQSSLRHGRFTQSTTLQGEVAVWRPVDWTKRFSYGFGADLVGGYTSTVDYMRYSAATSSWHSHAERPSCVWLQQLYGEIKWRSIFVTAGMKEHDSAILTQSLTSGDVVFSGNTRPIPEVRVGFNKFVDIPLTKKWLQISGECAYGKLIDYGWWKSHYNRYNEHISSNEWYNYKRAYFRTRPTEPFSATFGMQAAAVYGGDFKAWSRGVVVKKKVYKVGIKEFFMMLLPTRDGGEGFVSGNHVGSWDISLRYRFDNGTELRAYTQWLWEDGSGIGKLNGWDGLWGLEYKAAKKGLVSGALIEYLDFTNHSGPLLFSDAEHPDTNLPGHADGCDNYYNNANHNSYAYFGQSIGTPAMMAPIYNRDGYLGFAANVMRGFHLGVEGSIVPGLDYVVKGGYRTSPGSIHFLLRKSIHLTAVSADLTWRPRRVKGLSVNGSVELDRGTMPCNSFGVMIGLKYNGKMMF